MEVRNNILFYFKFIIVSYTEWPIEKGPASFGALLILGGQFF